MTVTPEELNGILADHKVILSLDIGRDRRGVKQLTIRPLLYALGAGAVDAQVLCFQIADLSIAPLDSYRAVVQGDGTDRMLGGHGLPRSVVQSLTVPPLHQRPKPIVLDGLSRRTYPVPHSG